MYCSCCADSAVSRNGWTRCEKSWCSVMWWQYWSRQTAMDNEQIKYLSHSNVLLCLYIPQVYVQWQDSWSYVTVVLCTDPRMHRGLVKRVAPICPRGTQSNTLFLRTCIHPKSYSWLWLITIQGCRVTTFLQSDLSVGQGSETLAD